MLHSAAHRRHVRDGLDFFLLWLRQPVGLGAVLPSGLRLARAMAAEIDLGAQGKVVELGGGTGSVTRAILDAGVGAADLVVVEREARFCRLIGARFPGVRVLEADARDLDTALEAAGVWPVRSVVSSLPLVSMAEASRRRIAEQVFAVLARGGALVQFTYAPKPPLSHRTCEDLGLVGARSSWVGLNLPPATVWVYRRLVEAPATRAAA